MQITRDSLDTNPVPSDWRTPWRTHPHGQTIRVTKGVGLCQRRGGPVEVIRPGHHVGDDEYAQAPEVNN